MYSNPPLPFDPTNQTDYTGWFDMINSIVGFVTASTHLATTLRNSRNCFPENVEITEVIEKIAGTKKNLEFYHLLDFPWFLNELNSVSQTAQHQKTPQYHMLDVVPLVQYPMVDIMHGEPNLEPRTFTLVDTKDFGDVDFKRPASKSVLNLNKHGSSCGSIPSVEKAKIIMKHNSSSSDSCYFEEYSDSEQTIDSLNLQENFEKMEGQRQKAYAKFSENKRGAISSSSNHSIENYKNEKVLEKRSEEIEQCSTIYEGTESTFKDLNKVDLYLECTAEDPHIVSKKVQNNKENIFKGDENKAVATYVDIMQYVSNLNKNKEEKIAATDNSKIISSSAEGTQVELKMKVADEVNLPKISKSQTVSPSAKCDKTVTEVNLDDEKKTFQNEEPKATLLYSQDAQVSTFAVHNKSLPVINLDVKQKSLLTEEPKAALVCSQNTQVNSRERKERKRAPGMDKSEDLTSFDELRRRLLECQFKHFQDFSKTAGEQTSRNTMPEKTVTLVDGPIVRRKKLQDTKKVAKESTSNKNKSKIVGLQNKRDPATIKDLKGALRKEGDTDFITKNIVNCLNMKKRKFNKSPADAKKNVSKNSGTPSPKVKNAVLEKVANKPTLSTHQPKNTNLVETRTRKASDRRSLSADAVKLNESSRLTVQQKIQSSIKRPIAKTVSNKEKPSVGQQTVSATPKSIKAETKTCLKPPIENIGIQKTGATQKEGLQTGFKWPEQVKTSSGRPGTSAVSSRSAKPEQILPKIPLIRNTTLKLTAAETVKKATELLKNVEVNVLRPTTEARKRVASAAAASRPFTSFSNKKR